MTSNNRIIAQFLFILLLGSISLLTACSEQKEGDPKTVIPESPPLQTESPKEIILKNIAETEKKIATLNEKIVSESPDIQLLTKLNQEKNSAESQLADLAQDLRQQIALEQKQINLLAQKDARKKRDAILKDIAAMDELIKIQASDEILSQAWNNLLAKYPTINKVNKGDIKQLCLTLKVPQLSIVEPITKMKLTWIHAGCFNMGSSEGDEDELPIHQVCLDGYYIGLQEVTQGQYTTIVKKNPAEYIISKDHPVERVSWQDTQAFIQELNKHSQLQMALPTEAQWEYASRQGPTTEKYSGSDTVDDVAWYELNAVGHPHKTAAKAPNQAGIFDMSGNVSEWCQDNYQEKYYASSPQDNPAGPAQSSKKVARGGSWYDMAWHTRTTNRTAVPSHAKYGFIGFRLIHQP